MVDDHECVALLRLPYVTPHISRGKTGQHHKPPTSPKPNDTPTLSEDEKQRIRADVSVFDPYTHVTWLPHRWIYSCTASQMAEKLKEEYKAQLRAEALEETRREAIAQAKREMEVASPRTKKSLSAHFSH